MVLQPAPKTEAHEVLLVWSPWLTDAPVRKVKVMLKVTRLLRYVNILLRLDVVTLYDLVIRTIQAYRSKMSAFCSSSLLTYIGNNEPLIVTVYFQLLFNNIKSLFLLLFFSRGLLNTNPCYIGTLRTCFSFVDLNGFDVCTLKNNSRTIRSKVKSSHYFLDCSIGMTADFFGAFCQRMFGFLVYNGLIFLFIFFLII